MSEVVAGLIRLGLRAGAGGTGGPSPSRRGMPVVEIGHPVTADDVRSLEDDG